ncbi:hypothetical protein [Thermococcus thioreducens]|uniref:Uncharacterized protein n=2 Tax=Thermococcus thioreducens TaxID=277988 RepID=A0A1I0Q433_9EURY|nr:hypothetical protein [Thermococcus thioreducens]SEW21304.1 hypothetical protein SAMN05216170_2146 [Thermococcus thioreducens]
MNKLKAVFAMLLLFGMLLPPASSAVIVSELRPPIIIMGNVPKDFVVGPYEEFTVYFYIADDFGVTVGEGKVEAYYRVNDGDWKQAYVKKAAAGENWSLYQSIIRRFYGESQDFYVFYRKINLPGAPPGSRIEFKIVVTDVEGHVSYSPVYSYYVANPDGPKVLIVDPSVEAMAFQKSLDSLMAQFNVSRSFYHYNLSDFEAVAKPLTRLKPWMLSDHHWEGLAKYYNIKIVSPDELVNALQSFQPQAVILSNLWLPDWGLSEDQISVLGDYLETHHAGLVVTAGTLFDATNPQHVGGTEDPPSLAKLLGLDSLAIADAARGELNLTQASVMVPYVNTGYSLMLSDRGPFNGGTIDVSTYSTVGWQCVLSPTHFGMAKRSVSRFASENSLRMREMGESVKNITGVQFNFSLSASMVLPGILSSMDVTDRGVVMGYNGMVAEIPIERKLLERVRLLHALRGYVPMLLARTSDYSGGILATDGNYRAVYSSLELEAGSEGELSVLRELVDWTLNYRPVQMPEVVILSNDIDWGIKGNLLASQLGAFGLSVKRATADDFEAYRDSRIIIILGGPDAYDGVGGYVMQVLTPGEQSAVRNGERGMFVKTNVWAEGQVVIVLAGQDRWATGGKIRDYMNGIDGSYLRILATFSVSVS